MMHPSRQTCAIIEQTTLNQCQEKAVRILRTCSSPECWVRGVIEKEGKEGLAGGGGTHDKCILIIKLTLIGYLLFRLLDFHTLALMLVLHHLQIQSLLFEWILSIFFCHTSASMCCGQQQYTWSPNITYKDGSIEISRLLFVNVCSRNPSICTSENISIFTFKSSFCVWVKLHIKA